MKTKVVIGFVGTQLDAGDGPGRWERWRPTVSLGLHEDFVHEGILGTTFTGRLVQETQVGPYRAVVPTLSGQAWITGFAQYVLDPDDPFPCGYTVGDIWS